MSEILKALKASEQNHQRYDAISTATTNSPLNVAPKTPRGLISVAFSVPVVITLSWLSYEAYHGYQKYQEQPSIVVKAEPEVIEVESAFIALPYIEKQELKTTQATFSNAATIIERELPQAVTTQVETRPVPPSLADTLSNEEIARKGPSTENESMDDLSQLDLSQFSPELAQRVQSAFSNEEEARQSHQPLSLKEAIEGEPKGNTIKLSQRGADFVGSLPAMNFQTHVYSSRIDKRWVKINGSEFTEGEKVSSDVTLVSIAQRHCTIEYQGQLIEVPALYDWKG